MLNLQKNPNPLEYSVSLIEVFSMHCPILHIWISLEVCSQSNILIYIYIKKLYSSEVLIGSCQCPLFVVVFSTSHLLKTSLHMVFHSEYECFPHSCHVSGYGRDRRQRISSETRHFSSKTDTETEAAEKLHPCNENKPSVK